MRVRQPHPDPLLGLTADANGRTPGTALPLRNRIDPGLALPAVDTVDTIPSEHLVAFITHLAALQSRAAARLQRLALEEPADDYDCFDVTEVARHFRCSPDLVRERGEEWGIAKVLARDARGRPTRVVYPRVRLRDFLRANKESSNLTAERRKPL